MAFLFLKISKIVLASFVFVTYVCRMRKEINLDKEAIEQLQELADKKKWSVKRYIEMLVVAHIKRYFKPKS